MTGNLVAKYTYDSWGKLVSIKDSNDVDKTTDENFIGYVNPIRYRGYYYDSETGLYYLNARYYDPEVGRFINADGTLDGGFNLFEYCLNNPIKISDLDGKVPTSELLNLIKNRRGLRSDCQYSFRNQLEVGCVIYEKNGVYELGRTTMGSSKSSWPPDDAEIQDKLANGYKIAAFWHTHPFATDCYSCCLSNEDVNYAKAMNAPIFSHAANGEIFGYDPSDNTYYNSTNNIRDIRGLDSHLIIRGISEQQFISELNAKFDLYPQIIIHSPYRYDIRLGRINWIKF